MNIYCLVFFMVISQSFCSFDEQDFIQEESDCCIEYNEEVTDQEYDEIIEYLMANYREALKTDPAFYEYCEQELERIENKSEQKEVNE